MGDLPYDRQAPVCSPHLDKGRVLSASVNKHPCPATAAAVKKSQATAVMVDHSDRRVQNICRRTVSTHAFFSSNGHSALLVLCVS